VAAMHHPDGRVAIPGFYDDVESVGETERAAWSELPFDEAACAQSLGLEVLAGGEKGLPPLERNWARPTLDCNGILGGYTGEGSKTIIPARASAKISMRLVARQDPQKVLAGFRRFVDENTPPGLRASVEVHATSPAVQVDLDSPAVAAAREALAEAFGRPPVMIRCGASVPATEVIQRRLGLHAVLMGFGLPEDNLHSPNERFALSQLYGGSVAAAAFL
ncbi:MAG TPA: hypothetical protein DCX07_02035, partial [Phycisphaerales bacterium]|nr:hypothetical protein [Phycisphaerales bacterium]